METLDIGLIQPELWLPRGGEKHFCKLAYWLKKKGHEITIYTFRKNKENYVFDSLIRDCKLVELGCEAFGRPLALRMPLIYENSRRLASKIQRHDILNGHNFPTGWVCGFSQQKSVWLCNDPPVFASGQHKRILDPWYRIVSMADKQLVKKISTICCLSNLAMKEIRKVYPEKEFPENRFVWVGAGAELDSEPIRSENDTTDILYVSPLIDQRRHTDIITAISYSSNKAKIVLHLAGEGENRDKLVNLAEKLGVKTIFYGKVSEKKLYELYGLSDMAVHPSDLEPWGIFPLEATLAGIPTIISDRVGCGEILKNNPVFHTGDISALQKLIDEIISKPEQYRKITETNRQIIMKEYSWEKHAERMLGVFRKTINE